MIKTLIAGFALSSMMILTPAAALPFSKATQYLIKQEIQNGCQDGKGTIAEQGVIERDLNGDGGLDLILSHEAISCAGTSFRSLLCGMQVCTIQFYVRQDGLLQLVEEFLERKAFFVESDFTVARLQLARKI